MTAESDDREQPTSRPRTPITLATEGKQPSDAEAVTTGVTIPGYVRAPRSRQTAAYYQRLQHVIQLYRAGLSTGDIAVAIGVSRERVLQILVFANEVRRSCGNPYRGADGKFVSRTPQASPVEAP